MVIASSLSSCCPHPFAGLLAGASSSKGWYEYGSTSPEAIKRPISSEIGLSGRTRMRFGISHRQNDRGNTEALTIHKMGRRRSPFPQGKA